MERLRLVQLRIPGARPPLVSARCYGVDCTSISFCVIVGQLGQYPVYAVSFRWNGRVVMDVGFAPFPYPPVSRQPHARRCQLYFRLMVYGGRPCWYGQRLPDTRGSMEWHPTGRTRVPTPSTAQPSSLSGVSCVSASSCVAVGTVGTGASIQSLTEQWNGTKLVNRPQPEPPGSVGDQLTSVSCFGPTSCVAVGSTQLNESPGNRVTLGRSLERIVVDTSAAAESCSNPTGQRFR